MPSKIILSSYNEEKTLYAVYEENVNTTWLYLCSINNGERNSSEIIADVFVCNLIDLIKTSELDKYKPNLPPITKDYGNPEAVCLNIENVDWQLKWLENNSILLMKNSKPWSLIVFGEKRGMSKSIKKSGPWGKSWHEKQYKKLVNQPINRTR